MKSRYSPGRAVGRKSLRDTLTDNLATFKAHGRPDDPERAARYDRHVAGAEATIASLGPKREYRKRDAVDIDAVHRKQQPPLEKVVLAEILRSLRRDPRVGFVWRQSSGTFREGERYIQAGPKGMPDICGVLLGGKSLFIEVKRPGGKLEPHQDQRLGHFRAIGAIAGMATSVAEALALLP